MGVLIPSSGRTNQNRYPTARRAIDSYSIFVLWTLLSLIIPVYVRLFLAYTSEIRNTQQWDIRNVIVVFNYLNGILKGQICLVLYVLYGMLTIYQPHDYGFRLVLDKFKEGARFSAETHAPGSDTSCCNKSATSFSLQWIRVAELQSMQIFLWFKSQKEHWSLDPIVMEGYFT